MGVFWNGKFGLGEIWLEKTRSKFNVSKDKEKRTYNGIEFDSQLEMKYFRDVICPKVESGDIVEYTLQKEYILQPKFIYNDTNVQSIKYVSDFHIVYKNGNEEVIDTKGMADPVCKIKRKIFWYLFPDIKYSWIGYSKIDGGFVDWDYIQKQRRERKKVKSKAGE